MAELTGRKVLVITVSAFAVIIGVNLLLAYKAVSTFPGLEVKNSY
ncbi:MAG: FixH family protein, partial [Paracoccaceae bacterium]|nr:FixH family protein [Paracoccaceae bacterium]